MISYDFCQRRDSQVFAVREETRGGGVRPVVTGAYGPLTEAEVDALHDADLPSLDYDANPAAAAWFRDNAGQHQWGYSLRAPFAVPISQQQHEEPTA